MSYSDRAVESGPRCKACGELAQDCGGMDGHYVDMTPATKATLVLSWEPMPDELLEIRQWFYRGQPQCLNGLRCEIVSNGKVLETWP